MCFFSILIFFFHVSIIRMDIISQTIGEHIFRLGEKGCIFQSKSYLKMIALKIKFQLRNISEEELAINNAKSHKLHRLVCLKLFVWCTLVCVASKLTIQTCIFYSGHIDIVKNISAQDVLGTWSHVSHLSCSLNKLEQHLISRGGHLQSFSQSVLTNTVLSTSCVWAGRKDFRVVSVESKYHYSIMSHVWHQFEGFLAGLCSNLSQKLLAVKEDHLSNGLRTTAGACRKPP